MSNVTLSAKLEELSQCKSIELFCIGLIYEFLVCNDFNKTLDIFIQEIKNSKFSLPTALPRKKDRIDKDDVIKIVSAFEIEDHLQFFERWTELIPGGIKNVAEYKNITLPLYTYFATLPMRREKQTPPSTQSMPIKLDLSKKYEDKQLLDVSGKESIDDRKKKIVSLNSTFILDKPTMLGNSDTDYASEKDADFDPDSLESETESNNTKTKMKHHAKTDRKTDTVIVISHTNFDAAENEVNANFIQEQSRVNEKFIEAEVTNNEKSGIAVKEDSNKPSAMTMFQEFLLEKKYSFNTEPQFLPLFALPFIQNPEEHEAFNQLFQDKWVHDLKESLHNFLIKYSCDDIVVPEIVKICRDNKSLKGLVKKHSESNDDYSKLYKEARKKLHRLKRDHKNLVGVASELASALENSVRGEAVDIKTTLYKCVTIFPELFSHTSSKPSTIHNGSIMGKIVKDKMFISPSQLDVKKIKEDLTSGSVKTKLLLLQALRWEVCRTECEEREAVVGWLSREDVLGLEGEKGYGRDWLGSLEPHPLQQSIARMLNCIASLRTGRDYIADSNPPLVPLVVAVVGRISVQDKVTLDMLIALLQKLSLRKEMCSMMIQHGLLDWLSSRLSLASSLYHLEYTTSLFMNLSIHAPVGYWDTRPHQILPPLLKLVTTPHEQVLEFVLGSLYCLLRSDKLNIFARSLGLSAELSGVSSHRCYRQAGALLKLHRRELSPAAVHLNHPQATEEDIEDPEEIEAEVNADDLVKGSPCGEQLLAQKYSILFPSPSIVSRGTEDRLHLRPSTPRAIHSLPAWAM